MKDITIDARMINNSGIGTYLQNILPKILQDRGKHFNLLGDSAELRRKGFSSFNNVTLVDVQSPIYSVSEQMELVMKIPRETQVFWVPHFNIPLLYKGILVVTVHDLIPLKMNCFSFFKRMYARMMYFALSKKAERIICPSQYTRQELLQIPGCNPSKVFAIHNGVASDWPTKGLAPHNRPYLIYVGNVKPHKNLGMLVEAFGSIAGKIPHDLIIVGKKEGFITGDERVMRAAGRLGDRITFTGFVSEELLAQYLHHAEAMIFPSLCEGFGFPPLEAMACGCPVIASNVSSIPEVCGDAVLYCDPYNSNDIAHKIIMLLENKGLAEELRKKGRIQACKYSWTQSAAETLGIIENLI